MKLTTRSRYGTRMMLDLAEHYDEGPVHIADISKRQDISVKYLEQLIIPLKKGDFIKSVRGPKGGHLLAKSPEKITIGEIVKLLEGGIDLTGCVANPDECQRSSGCPTRSVWEEATKAMYDKLNSITLEEMLKKRQRV
ncbi:RrF2 family transcriptional regulator [Thermodesulfobacteriota bacterium]